MRPHTHQNNTTTQLTPPPPTKPPPQQHQDGLDGQDGQAICHQSSDAVNPFTSCYRDEEGTWIRGNFSMYTGKDDINKVGQWKRLNYREVRSTVVCLCLWLGFGVGGVWGVWVRGEHGSIASAGTLD